MPHDPIAFSYWVVSSLPLDDSMKITLLAINSATQRLRAELHLMRAVGFLFCLRDPVLETRLYNYCNSKMSDHQNSPSRNARSYF